ncbi:hypothetical protein C8R43DRAFT_1167831 [Mycena crocata]|nr:hypothetical protein C8R43DRAFT_1167831 [Mycena crocata]
MFVFATKLDSPSIHSSHLGHCFVRSQLEHPSHSRLCLVLSLDTLQANSPPWRQSTLATGLLQKPPADDKDDHRTDFPVGYDFANVLDDADEGAPVCCIKNTRARSFRVPKHSCAPCTPCHLQRRNTPRYCRILFDKSASYSSGVKSGIIRLLANAQHLQDVQEGAARALGLAKHELFMEAEPAKGALVKIFVT